MFPGREILIYTKKISIFICQEWSGAQSCSQEDKPFPVFALSLSKYALQRIHFHKRKNPLGLNAPRLFSLISPSALKTVIDVLYPSVVSSQNETSPLSTDWLTGSVQTCPAPPEWKTASTVRCKEKVIHECVCHYKHNLFYFIYIYILPFLLKI